MSASAVSACSPPESSVSVCGFLPGGWATSSRPASSGIVGFDQLQLGLAALEQGREQVLEMAVDDLEGGDEPLAPLLVQGMDRAAQALDRLGQVVALGDQLVAAIEDLDELLVGAQVDGAEPLALLAQIVEPALDLDRARQGPIAVCPASAARPEGSQSSSVAIACMSSSPRRRAPFDALLRRRALLARRRHRFERLAGGAVGVGERGLAERERVGGLLARGFGLGELVGERMRRGGRIRPARRRSSPAPAPLRRCRSANSAMRASARARRSVQDARSAAIVARRAARAWVSRAKRLRRGARFA